MLRFANKISRSKKNYLATVGKLLNKSLEPFCKKNYLLKSLKGDMHSCWKRINVVRVLNQSFV